MAIDPHPTSQSVRAGPRFATATRSLRKMRGPSQAHLLMADDGRAYVVKFSSHPQRARTLVNELVASAVLAHLRISAPKIGLIRITEGFLKENPDVYLHLGTRRCAVTPGLHCGSSYPGDPNQACIFDFLPEPMLAGLVNKRDFLGALVVDKWTAKLDPRQSIFVRTMPAQIGFPGSCFMVQMIAHGSAFGGAAWQFRDSPLAGLYFRSSLYAQVRVTDFQPWIDELARLPEQVLKDASAQVPEEWLQGDDRSRLETMLGDLLRRRTQVTDLLGACLERRNAPTALKGAVGL